MGLSCLNIGVSSHTAKESSFWCCIILGPGLNTALFSFCFQRASASHRAIRDRETAVMLREQAPVDICMQQSIRTGSPRTPDKRRF